MGAIVEDVLNGVPDWVLYLTVFLLPFLEASVFLGFVFPGETALVFGGVLAGRGQVSLSVLLILAVLGAITGDAVGYSVGRRYGTALQASRLGQRIGDDRWLTTEAFLQRRGGTAVFFGRWTALLRAMVPGAAGMAKLPYRTFFLWNILGGTLWAVACVYGGYLVGDAVSRYVSNFGYVILGLVAVVIAVHFVQKYWHRDRVTSDLSGS
jgi:membrane protein DedA with SNARE-associated domain